jgi:peroxiredoxin Q/BCP
MAVLVGAQAPDFTLPGVYGKEEGSFTLSGERGHPVALAFYPGDERLVCTRQMCAYSDSVGDLHLFDGVVWGISPSTLAEHRRFAEDRRLKMPLLADVDKAVARDFGVVGPFGLRRSVFVVDADGRIAWRWVSALNATFPGADEVRRRLHEAAGAA